MPAARTDLAPLGKLEFETAVEHVCRVVPRVAPGDSAAAMRASLELERFEHAAHLAVIDDERLVGILRIEDLLPAPARMTAAALMDREPPLVGPGLDQEQAAWHAVSRGESALAVQDEEGRFVGFVPPARLLEVLMWEHNEDIARLGGVLRRESIARRAQDEPLVRRLWRRLPWLALGLGGALLAAIIVEHFEHSLAARLELVMFLPGVVYLAAAVGMQTETLVVRGLSLGFDYRRMVFTELVTGLAIALVLPLLFFAGAALVWGRAELVATIALALAAATASASVVALALPWILTRLGSDPAIGSGPLATVTQDLLSITIYFTVATALL
ncbi:MAG: magnesium transporter [Gammaproteobacteria bacterium]